MTMEQMSSLALILVTVVAVSQVVGLGFLGVLLYRTWEQTRAFGAANFLQGREMKAILLEVREELTRHR